MNLVTIDYDVIPSNGSFTGICHCEVRATAGPGIETDPNANDFDPDPTYPLDNFTLQQEVSPDNSAGIDQQFVYSPNGQGGEDGPDTIKGPGLIFTPAGDRPATDVRLLFTIVSAAKWASQLEGFPIQVGVWGSKIANAPLWSVAGGVHPFTGEIQPFFGAVTPYSASSRTDIFAVDLTTSGAKTTGNIASAYNQIRQTTGFAAGNNMCFMISGLPWYGGIIGSIETASAILRVTVDLEAPITSPTGLTRGDTPVRLAGRRIVR